MIIIEIPDNPNCETVDMRLFHDLEPPQTVRQVRLERRVGVPEWYAVTGWTASGEPCPAQLQKVDDSGDGTAFLVYGGDGGLRLKPASSAASWRLDGAEQWGEPFLIVADPTDTQVET